ncbi:hypothetical protein [Nonomuraea glycinis]|uniref:hypothetical protein n=1 Tax=Nonomuraea glycinis TaxID=2047744 RepID=UPI0033BAC9C6
MMRGGITPEQSPHIASIAPAPIAERLRRELERHGITADVNDGYGLAVVSVWHSLIVWTDGAVIWWRVGWSRRRNRPVYAWHPASEPQQAANRVALRYANLRARDHTSAAASGPSRIAQRPGPTLLGGALP